MKPKNPEEEREASVNLLTQIRAKKRLGRVELTDEEFAILDAWWKSGETSDGTIKPPTYRMSEETEDGFLKLMNLVFGTDETPLPPHKVKCSFCWKVIDRSTATISKANIRVRNKLVETTPDIVMKKIIFSDGRLIACPDHALMIKPKLNKDGSYSDHNIIYEPGD